MSQYIKAVVDYYDDIDNHKLAKVLRFFDDDANYTRDGRLISGKTELTRFYRQDRPIASGYHNIEWIKAKEGVVRTKGQFFGFLKSGKEVTVKFLDTFHFAGTKVTKRVTIFLEGDKL